MLTVGERAGNDEGEGSNLCPGDRVCRFICRKGEQRQQGIRRETKTGEFNRPIVNRSGSPAHSEEDAVCAAATRPDRSVHHMKVCAKKKDKIIADEESDEIL